MELTNGGQFFGHLGWNEKIKQYWRLPDSTLPETLRRKSFTSAEILTPSPRACAFILRARLGKCGNVVLALFKYPYMVKLEQNPAYSVRSPVVVWRSCPVGKPAL